MNSKKQVLDAAEAAVTYANKTKVVDSFPPWTTVSEHAGNINVAINTYKLDLPAPYLQRLEGALLKLQALDSRTFFKRNANRKVNRVTVLASATA